MSEAASEMAPILLVEDEDLARGSLGRMLGMKYPAHPLFMAENGQIGLELYRRHQPKVVITDINMPQLNGLEMIRAIRAENPQARIIVISAHSELQYLQEVESVGTDIHYLLKPTDRNELFALVGRCLEG